MSIAKSSDSNPDRKILPEEVKFDKRVYGGISYFAQAAAGILLTRSLKFGSLKPLFEKATTTLGPMVYRNRSVEKAAAEISTPLLVTTMVMVGNAFLLPVKWLENRKASIVRDWTEKDAAAKAAQGTPYSQEEIAQQQAALKDLEKEPNQSWASLIGGRVFGLIPVFALAYGLGKKGEIAEKFASNTVSKGLGAVGAKGLANSNTVKSYVQVGFLDIFYSAISAAGLYSYSHFMHPTHKKDEDPAKHNIKFGPTPGGAIVDPTPTTNMPQLIDEPESARKKFADQVTRTQGPDPVKNNPNLTYREKLATEQLSRSAHAIDRTQL